MKSKLATIKRIKGGFSVQMTGNTSLANVPGVTCLNPKKPEGSRIYEKIFRNKRIYLPPEYEKAISENLPPGDNFIVSMNGYSRITEEQCFEYGIKPLAYEEACKAILRKIVETVRNTMKGAKLQLIDGASRIGVDSAILDIADEFNIRTLGFSCPEYMFYVEDDDHAVYVAEDSDTYADLYVQSLDLLITTGGRKQALVHDIAAACIHGKRIHFVDVLSMLSDRGRVPATIVNKKGEIEVTNAAAAFDNTVSFFSREGATVASSRFGDKWDWLFADTSSVAIDVCRRKMSPRRMFQ